MLLLLLLLLLGTDGLVLAASAIWCLRARRLGSNARQRSAAAAAAGCRAAGAVPGCCIGRCLARGRPSCLLSGVLCSGGARPKPWRVSALHGTAVVAFPLAIEGKGAACRP